MLVAAVCVAAVVAGCGEQASSAKSPAEWEASRPQVPQGPKTTKLVVKDLREGDGETVKLGDYVAVHYVAGVYETGKEIESAWQQGEPLGLHIGNGGVLPGWEKGVPGMRVGGRRELIFPATRAHVADRGAYT